MHPVRTAAILLALLTLSGATMAIANQDKGKSRGKHGRTATAALLNAERERIGRVWFHERRDGDVWVYARARDLPPGFHGFHIHAIGDCRAPDFTSAAGHLKAAGQNHPGHIGDLPVLLVNSDGTGKLVTVTDRFSVRDLRDDDGSAVIVHASPDNYANIPTDRYDPDPDQTTLDTGDAGARLACGEVR